MVLQVFFMIFFINFQVFQPLEETVFQPLDAAVSGTDIYQNDVFPHFADAVPWDDVIVPGAEETEKPAFPRNDQGGDTALRHLDPGIGHISQPLPVPDADDFFAVQIRKLHTQPPKKGFGAVYGLRLCLMKQ